MLANSLLFAFSGATEPTPPPVGSDVPTITAGSTAIESWSAWTPTQRGSSGDAGYTASPPGQWITPQRTILKAGDLVGIRAACSEVCGTLSIEVSLNNGTILTLTEQTVDTDEWGTTAAHWFKIPEGLAFGRHELRARLIPSIAGLDRVLQGYSEAHPAWTSHLQPQAGSLIFAIDPQEYYVVVDPTSPTNAGDIGRVSIDGPVENFTGGVFNSLFDAMGGLEYWISNNISGLGGNLGSYRSDGGVIYLKAGNYSAKSSYSINNQWWVTVKRHPSAAVDSVTINSATDASNPVSAKFVKYDGIKFDLSTSGTKIYTSEPANAFWFNDSKFAGTGQTLVSYPMFENAGSKMRFHTGILQNDIKAEPLGFGHSALVRNFEMNRCTSDILTGVAVAVSGIIRNHRSLNSGTDSLGNAYSGLDEHGDLKQQVNNPESNFIIAEVQLYCDYVAGDNGTALLQFDGAATQNTLIENLYCAGLAGGGGGFEFFGADPVGNIYRNVDVTRHFSTSAFSTSATFKGNELTNCIFNEYQVNSNLSAAVSGNLMTYSGNHRYGSGTSPSSDTTGTPQFVSGTRTPTAGGNLTGRTRRTLLDAAGNRRSETTTAGAFRGENETL